MILRGRLRAALARLNPGARESALDAAERKLLQRESPSLTLENRRLHRLLVDGIEVEVPALGGGVRGERVRVLDFDAAAAVGVRERLEAYKVAAERLRRECRERLT